MTEAYFILAHDKARIGASSLCMTADEGTVVQFKPKTRSLEQNTRLWRMLTDLSKQVQWSVDGKLQYLSPEDWKDICTAGLRKNQSVAQGIEGGFVLMGQRTSKMTVGEMKELQDFMEWFGASREPQVQWTPPKDHGLER
jgi:hypothetical protein